MKLVDSNRKGTPDRTPLRQLFQRIWVIGILGALFDVWNQMEANVFTPFIYTRVQCCGDHGPLPSKYDITDARRMSEIRAHARLEGLPLPRIQTDAAGRERILGCDLPHFQPKNRMWSKSPGCVSGSYVQNQAQNFIGINTPLQKAACLVALPVGGKIADEVGRRPVLFVYAIMCFVSCAIYVADTKLFAIWGNIPAFVAGMLICPCWEPKDTVMTGSVVDLVGANVENRSRALSVQYVFYKCGCFCGYAFAFYCLGQHLTSYFRPFVVFTILAGIIAVYIMTSVPETLPAELKKPLELHMFSPLQVMREAFRLIARDWMLITLLVTGFLFYIHMVGFVTLVFSYLIGMGFTPQEAMLPGVFGIWAQMISAGLVAKFGPDIGTYNLQILSHVFFAIGYVLFGPLIDTCGHIGPYFAWSCFGVGWSLFFPSAQTIISQRVEEEHQAKCQACFAVVLNLGAIFGPPIWSYCIYDATATGIAKAKPAITSLVLSVICICLATYMRARSDVFLSVMELDEEGNALPLKSSKAGSHRVYGA